MQQRMRVFVSNDHLPHRTWRLERRMAFETSQDRQWGIATLGSAASTKRRQMPKDGLEVALTVLSCSGMGRQCGSAMLALGHLANPWPSW